MAVTKNALIRYKTIDKCLQNHYRDWTLASLMEACSDALYEFEGRSVNVSKRTLQMDIQVMRSDKLGYNAPIEVYDRKFYRYADPEYSITDIPLTETDMGILTETMNMLKQFQDFSLFADFKGIINKLEDKIYTEQHHKNPIIHLDKNDNLKGLEWLNELYQAILKQVVIKLMYQSFKAYQPQEVIFHAHFLKEYNNRWFVIGRTTEKPKIITFALDRILGIDYDFGAAYIPATFDVDAYYQHTIGVTVMEKFRPSKVIFKVDRSNAPYVLTKPFHASQEVYEKHADGSITFIMRVHLNFELERMLLGFGDYLEVLAPKMLRRNMKRRLTKAAGYYEGGR
ncbi:Predicted DNA-binding transcriptional regulator YafY, contains an HTH and WYL domains [Pustulibacterium marinum]|uniref:Predicted DNA-binding transcriptional regulator YafY, contains an HTH and WYL domains n=1 Tax=Pustulibacterium marinum TaxID=1224947 RepID=A0A1I7FN34_9FLAO|nr:WYL domain-containing protein [Pustulibacterium marinum]SFU37584.1 Predicted DNA-binding transcriptional regulator YafY, contains an HTH and WYL domains [Pustulibacterium marinum]